MTGLSFGTDELEGDAPMVFGHTPPAWPSQGYDNGIDYTRLVISNCYTNFARFHFARFDTQQSTPTAEHDYLTMTWGTGTQFTWSGHIPTGSPSPDIEAAQSLQSHPIGWRFVSDFEDRFVNTGFKVSDAEMACSDTCDGGHYLVDADSTNPAEFVGPQRFDGFLWGTGDVVYVDIDAHALRRVHLWGAPGTDFNLFARCGADPTGTSLDIHDPSPRKPSQHSIELPTPCGEGDHLWHVAAHSRRGSGIFGLFVFSGPQWVTEEFDVGTTFDVDNNSDHPGATSVQVRAAIDKVLMATLKQWYSVSQGRVYLKPHVRVHNNDGCQCGYPNHLIPLGVPPGQWRDQVASFRGRLSAFSGRTFSPSRSCLWLPGPFYSTARISTHRTGAWRPFSTSLATVHSISLTSMTWCHPFSVLPTSVVGIR